MDDTDRITSFSSQAADLGDMLYTANRDIKRLIAERNYAKTLKGAAVAQLTIARQERDAARSEIATYRKTLDEVSEIATKAIDERDALRAIAQAALDKGSDRELVYAPLYQQALEAIASEPQDK